MSETAASLEERVAQHFVPNDVSEDTEQELSPEAEAEEPNEQLEAAPEESASEEGTSAEFEEVEYEGKKYQVPPELKDALMAKADYTAKTTETARLRDALTLQHKEVALFQEQKAFEQSVAEDVDNLKMLDAYIQHEKSSTDWSQLSTDQIVRKKMEIDQLADKRNELAKVLEDKRNEFKNKLSEERNKLKESSKELLSKSIPNWNDDVKTSIEKALLERGYPEIAIQNMTALDYQIAWEASQYRQLKEGKASALKQAKQTPPIVKPGASKPMPNDVKEKLNFKKQLDKAKKEKLPEGQQARLIQQRLEQKLRRLS